MGKRQNPPLSSAAAALRPTTHVSLDHTLKPTSFALGIALGSLATAKAGSAPWKFGLVGDTQWPYSREYDSLGGFRNPNGVAVDILRQIDRRFIEQGVEFVIAVGDLSDHSTDAAYHVRATWAQPLYDAGIGFFPVRGNHDDYAEPPNAAEFVRVFPQTRDGLQNRTPSDAFDWTDSATLHPAFADTGHRAFAVGTGFSSPRPSLRGLTYAFAYDNATFVLLDQYRTPDPSEANTIPSQIPWMDSVLRARPAGTHAFVLGHKGIVTEYHADNLFGSSPAADSAGTNAFLRSLSARGVHWYIGGHDHIQNRSLITATNDTAVRVEGIILGTASYKSYLPASRSLDSIYDLPAFGRLRQRQLAQDLSRIGYMIVTVDGPRATAEYWAAPVFDDGADMVSVPDLSDKWTLRETSGYSLDGRQFLVPQQGAYDIVRDSGFGTRLRILGGTNADRTRDHSGRAFWQQVSVGWSETPGLSSATATLWGMRLQMGSDRTSPFALSLSYDRSKLDPGDLLQGRGVLLRRAGGAWRNAVASNTDGTPAFALRPWSKDDPLGTYGIDTAAGTAWAVIHHVGDFAIGIDTAIPPSPRPERDRMRFSDRSLLLPQAWSDAEVRIHSLDGTVRNLSAAGRRRDLGDLPPGLYVAKASLPGYVPLVSRFLLPATGW